MSAEPEDEAGSVIGGWRLARRLGGGAEGVVYLATSLDGLAKEVALKRFPRASAGRYRRELEAYRRVEEIRRASGTARLVEGISAGDLPDGGGYIALGYLEGGSLADHVRAGGPLPPEEAVRLVRDVLEALALLHGAGLCHRDVKPANILLRADGGACLGDFGLTTPQDRTISAGGTPAFAAPEQWDEAAAGASGERAGVPIDVYGAGATLFWLLTGKPPLPGRPDVIALEHACAPRGLQDVLFRALEVDPAARFESAAAFSTALEAAIRPPEPARPATSLPGPVIAFLVVVIAFYQMVRSCTDAPRAPAPPAAAATPAAPDARALAPSEAPLPASHREPPPLPPGVSPVSWLDLPDGRVAVATLEGRVLIADPRSRGAAPREVASFASGVLALSLEGGDLVITGDDRAETPLADGAEAPAGCIVLGSDEGRFAFPREPIVRTARVPIR